MNDTYLHTLDANMLLRIYLLINEKKEKKERKKKFKTVIINTHPHLKRHKLNCFLSRIKYLFYFSTGTRILKINKVTKKYCKIKKYIYASKISVYSKNK